MAEEEIILNIPLRNARKAPRTERAERAMIEIRKYVVGHLKAKEEDVWIDGRVNELVWSRGIRNSPSIIRVKAVKFEDGLVELSLAEE
ncbi:MAG: 50S ribosomal protein L31e [Methanomassiliicoccales archaeon]|jgi:large subunit ribosomal protein L31e|nr:50S ribosomal protein L31e [Methanomassiliicoccales archaeon]